MPRAKAQSFPFCAHHPDRDAVGGTALCAECFARAQREHRRTFEGAKAHKEVDAYLAHCVEQESLPPYLRTPFKADLA